MKEINSQLTDAMIIALADSYDMGVNFSDSVNNAKIPEVAIVEANEYWQLLSAQGDFCAHILPPTTIVDSLFSRMETFSPEIVSKEPTPSPYMKYVMFFAAPLSIIVMILGISFRGQPRIDVTKTIDINPALSSNTVAPTADTVNKPTSVSPKPQIMAARMAKVTPTQEEIIKSDPKQLFAMLSDAGSQESQSDTIIDDAYDAQLTELDSKVIGPDNTSTYAPL